MELPGFFLEHLEGISPCEEEIDRQRQYEREKRLVYSMLPPNKCDAAIRVLSDKLGI